MARKTEGEANGFKIFDKQGKTNERLAVDLASGTVIETDGTGKFFLYVNGRQHAIKSDHTLEQISGLEEVPAAEQ
jgi:hypothetical protein